MEGLQKILDIIYFDGEKERHYVKRFLIENENREDVFISEHASSVLEIVSTDWRPVAKIAFAKDRGKERREDQIIDFEQFISVKGVSALGNQLTKLKVNQIDLMESLPYEEAEEIPADEIDVVGEEVVDTSVETSTEAPKVISENPVADTKVIDKSKSSESDLDSDASDEEGQTTLF